MTAYLISMATFAGFFMILALALNLQWGMTGMVNFGIAGFYATGAYTSGLLTTDAGWPFLAGFFAAGLLAMVFGVGLALLSMRLLDLSLVGLEDNGGVQHPFGTAGYDQITTLLLAIAKAKSSDGLKIAEAIHQVSNGAGKSVYKIEDGLAALAAGEEINFDGASSTVEYESPTGVLSSRDFGFWKIEGGKNKLLSSVKS